MALAKHVDELNPESETEQVLKSIEDRFNDTCSLTIHNLTSKEYRVISNIRPLLDGIAYPPGVLKLHWGIIMKELEHHSLRLDNDPTYEIDNHPRLVRFGKDVRTPDYVRDYAIKLRAKVNEIMLKRVIEKCKNNPDVTIHDLTRNEQQVLDNQNMNKFELPDKVRSLHWKLAHHYLSEEMNAYVAGKLEPNDALKNKIKFFLRSKIVPEFLREFAQEFSDKLPVD